MDTTALQYFLVVAQTQHMGKAAELLHITQPSLSTSIRRLEANLGYPLFDRTGRGIQLNEYGRIFQEGVSKAETAVRASLEEMAELKKSSVNFVRLACSGSPSNSALIDLLLSQNISLMVDNIPDGWEQALTGKSCDLVITMAKAHRAGIAHTILRFQRLVATAGKNHPLASAETVTLDDLNRCAFCSTNASYSLINVVRDHCPDYDFHPHISFLGRNSADMIKALHSGAYIGLMVAHNLEKDSELTALPVSGFDISLPLYLYWREADTGKRSLSSIRQKIIDFYSSYEHS